MSLVAVYFLITHYGLPQDLGIGASHKIIGMIYIVAADIAIAFGLQQMVLKCGNVRIFQRHHRFLIHRVPLPIWNHVGIQIVPIRRKFRFDLHLGRCRDRCFFPGLFRTTAKHAQHHCSAQETCTCLFHDLPHAHLFGNCVGTQIKVVAAAGYLDQDAVTAGADLQHTRLLRQSRSIPLISIS